MFKERLYILEKAENYDMEHLQPYITILVLHKDWNGYYNIYRRR